MARNHIHQHGRLHTRLNPYQMRKRSNRIWFRRLKPSLYSDAWTEKGISSRMPLLPALWAWIKGLFRKDSKVLS